MQKNLFKAVIAGLVATFAMTLLMIMAPMMGMPEMNIGKMLGMFMGMPEFLGWAGHFMIGAILAIIYVYVFAQKLPGGNVLRGVLFGFIPWLIAQLMMNPMMGAGIFASNTPDPVAMVMGSLMGHIVYGAVLGAIYRVKSINQATAVIA
ncbi:MAG: DUF2938 family protein [Bacteroidetes bacterium]|nr:MAG: DUF2938 family protein [Bacteroidota bacterium]